jgi:hypothetical protein
MATRRRRMKLPVVSGSDGQGIPKEELARGNPRARIREAGLKVEEFTLPL